MSEVRSESKMEVILDLIESDHLKIPFYFSQNTATQGLLVKLYDKYAINQLGLLMVIIF